MVAPAEAPPGTKPSWYKRRWVLVTGAVLLLLIVVAIASPKEEGGTELSTADESTTTDEQEEDETTSTEAEVTTTERPTTTAQPTTTLPGFEGGTKLVNDEVAPGIYTAQIDDSCYWARLSGVGGTFEEIIANDNVSGRAIVEVAASDVAFESNGCGRWELFTPPDAPESSFGAGDAAVNSQVLPGRYRSDGTGPCYWARLSSFLGGFEAIIANQNTEGSAIVDIGAGDVGFESNGCGSWTKVGWRPPPDGVLCRVDRPHGG